jgi:hypothetical protein
MAEQHAPAPPTERTGVPYVVLLAALLAVGVFAALWWTTRSDLADLRATEAARVAAEEQLPDVFDIVADHVSAVTGYEISGDETYARVSITGAGLLEIGALEDALDALGFPSSTGSKIQGTRALDGTLTASGDGVAATWTYHPDDGLRVVVERTR